MDELPAIPIQSPDGHDPAIIHALAAVAPAASPGFCVACGAPLRSGHQFCTSCGRTVAEGGQFTSQPDAQTPYVTSDVASGPDQPPLPAVPSPPDPTGAYSFGVQVSAPAYSQGTPPMPTAVPVGPPPGPSTPYIAPRKPLIVAPVMSYTGSARRIWKLTEMTENPGGRATLAVLAVVLIAFMWMIVTAWYVIAFGLFGVFVIPFRIMTRGNRKRNAQAEMHHQEMMAMLHQQQQYGR